MQAIQDELSYLQHRSDRRDIGGNVGLRLVRLNGVAIPGHNVVVVVREMLRQLTAAAHEETKQSKDSSKKGAASLDQYLALEKHHQQASFVNNLQLVNEIFQIAQLDGVPIVLVLDELDAFLGNSKGASGGSAVGVGELLDDKLMASSTDATSGRQVLLYHLLDRVATDGSLVSLVGLTCHYALVRTMEKRIQSRAQGTTTWIPLGAAPLKYEIMERVVSTMMPRALYEQCASLRQLIAHVHGDEKFVPTGASLLRVREALYRDWRLGKPVRWFMRIWLSALSLYRWDIDQCSKSSGRITPSAKKPNIFSTSLDNQSPDFDESYLIQAFKV